MKKANMLVSAMSKNDVIATSGIDHTLYDHYCVTEIDYWGTSYEIVDLFKYQTIDSKFKYQGKLDETYQINIPNAVVNCYYIKVNGTWIKCEETHQIKY